MAQDSRSLTSDSAPLLENDPDSTVRPGECTNHGTVTTQVAGATVEAANARLEFLVRAGVVLMASLEYEERLHNLARLVVPYLADWCSIDLIDREGEIRRLLVLHADPARADAAHALQTLYPRLWPDTTHTITKVLWSGQPWLDPAVSPERLAREARDPQHLELLRCLGFSSEMVLPMLSRGRLLGTITLVRDSGASHYTHDDLVLAQELASRAAMAIDNARLYRQAQEAIRARDEFLAVASHELKTPLAALRLQTQYLLRQAETGMLTAMSTDRLMALMKMGDRQIRQLTKIIDDLLDVSRIEAGRLRLDRDHVDLASLVRDVIDRFAEEAAARGSQIHYSQTGSLSGHWDRFRLDQALTNLISNALKYGASQPIEVWLEGEADRVRVTVRDQGIGIAPEDLPRIFDRFERAVSNRDYSGLGLGLYISRQVIEAHGGKVQVTSAPGTGSTFTIELPRFV